LNNDSARREPASPALDPEERALAEARAALDRGGAPNEVIEPTYGLTRMHVAARAGHAKLLQFLIRRGGDVNAVNTGGAGAGGETPLHWASTGEVVDLLLAEGAAPAALGPAGQPPLASMALRNRRSALVRLIEHGADVKARDTLFAKSMIAWACTGLAVDYGYSALNQYEDRTAIIEHLVKQGADVNARDNDGETALHGAAKYDARFVALLLRLGADPSIRDKSGRLPIDWSRQQGLEEAVTILRGSRKQ
jgi:ankyrin repeat protein